MTYQQTIDYLFAQLPMFSRIGAIAYKADLHNTIALCNEIRNPHTTFKTIHIAGTNGKGSTSHMLAAILQKAGYKTGLYTSPHLKDFRERIKINGQMISEDFVIDFVQRTKKISEDIQPSFFELTVAMAFDYFAHEKVDIAVIETGLGGRLDSTNIITPVLSVITNIGYDHMNILGDTLDKIASEKAGIIKKNIPVVVGEYLPETQNIFIDKACIEQAPLFFAQEEYSIGNVQSSSNSLQVELKSIENKQKLSFDLDLNGLYQTKNVRTVICAIKILQQYGFTIKDDAIRSALSNVKKLTGLHGRWDVIEQEPTVVLDVAHNEDGIKQVLMQVEQWTISNEQSATSNEQKIHFVIGMVKDKEVSKVLELLPKEAVYYFTNAHIPRALPAVELQQKASEYNLYGEIFDDVNQAIISAKLNASKNDMIIVCGSVFLVGEVTV
ncbi:bifunctional folylpolyglutamate synthase/dihydrofolate synthase [Ferruginibacter lapsinanis]|uniref:bifunctional folylpolyglutamate synthase/dihydrofolate synthase n=1 Tax=Ferruginibacter lapsinanis TaxID=563172 RepID=UPI001E582C3E|nr:folylpolyglutamate synthase/dihydrofolate synthase family protein [Ferruginibacter lapsinanis]UEG49853.1 bifunctional folylpolyglutamate synthase/dihydrofolate synthase [Ferruginibacter lapsinanis]